MSDVETKIQLHQKDLDFLKDALLKHSKDDTEKFTELKDLLTNIRDSAVVERERMFSIFNDRLLELKADFKIYYQTKADAEASQSKIIKGIILGLFSFGVLIIAIVELVQR